jgi:rubredoxin
MSIQEWQLKATPCHKVKCSNCGWETSADGTKEQAIAELKRLGWQLRSNGPRCPECELQHELSMDNSEVYPK